MPEQPQSEEQFRRNYECLRRLFDYAGDAIFVHGLDGRFTDVNRAACEMLGYAREELLAGMFPWEFVVRDSREALQAHWAEMEPGVPMTVTDELRRKDGTTFPAEVRLVRYRADDGEMIIAICRDITKRRQAEEARDKAEIAMLEAKPTRISIEVVFGKDAITLTVTDDGSGITMSGSGDPKTGYGVSAMHERAREMGGRIELGNVPAGGTQIVVTVATGFNAPSPA